MRWIRKTPSRFFVLVAITFLATGAAVEVSQRAVQAADSDLHIKELMAGANGNSKIQFLVIEQQQGQNLWGPQPGETESRAMLVFFDAVGRETGKFKFPKNPATGGSLQTLIATREFANLRGAPAPDVIIPPLLIPIAGKVCFRNNPANSSALVRNECVSYGSHAGDAPPLPILNTVSLRRTIDTGRNSDFRLNSRPTPMNIGGASFTLPLADTVEQGGNLFNNETFLGNGRTCATCHIANDNLRLSPGNVQSRFASLGSPSFSFDPLFIGEFKPSSFDAGFDFNLNTLVLTSPVATPAPCTGALSGNLTTENGGRGKVLASVSPTTYLIYGGFNPMLTGDVTDGVCSGTVSSVTAGDLAVAPGSTVPGLEDPKRMRTSNSPTQFPQGRALILENIDGFSNPPVFRKSPHLLNLSRTGPFGFSGDIQDLQSFITGAVKQHFPRTLARNSSGPNPDFRLPTPDETAAMEAFLRAQEFPAGNDPNKFDLDRLATTSAQRQGRSEFFGTTAQPNCSTCHGGPTLSQTTVSIQGKPIGVNASFNTGAANLIVPGDSLPCEPSSPCNSREFSVPPLLNLSSLGPFFHNASVSNILSAVAFYFSGQFINSPANAALGAQGLFINTGSQITSFLAGLAVRPYTLSAGPIRFGLQAVNGGPTASQSISITNTGSSSITFFGQGCALTGTQAAQFVITSCPLTTPLGAGQTATITVAFDPSSPGLKSAILEVNAPIPSGIDLFGVGDVLPSPPTLTSIAATSGTTDGGDSVTLTGSNFINGTTVTIGGVRVGFLKVVSPTSITARTSAHDAGAADVVVTNPDGQSATIVNGFNYTASLPLSLTSIVPASGTSLGSSVTINGTGFHDGAIVTFAGVSAGAVNVVTSSTITATTPAHAPATVGVCVINLDAQQVCLLNAYTYVAAAAPILSSLTPTSGSYLGGTEVILQGANFAPGSTVTFGGVAGVVVAITPTTIRVRTAPSAPGIVDVVVTNADGQSATRSNGFSFLPPTITTVAPTSGATAGGTNVSIQGNGFLSGATVTFGGLPATNVFVSGQTAISVTTPAHAAGTVSVVVTNSDGQTATLTNGFSYIPPTITALFPNSGTTVGGTRVTIQGTGFGSGATVTFGGEPATNVSSFETSISATTPAHAAGAVNVVVTTASGSTVTSLNGFTYILPTINFISPTSGTTVGGSNVTISGSGFGLGALVTFDGVAGTNVFVNSETFLSVRTPGHAPGGVDVTVTNVDATSATRVNGFTYVGPVITAINPPNGNTGGGTTVTINGTGFAAGATVTFGGTAATVVTISESFINVLTPAHAPGLANVIVTNSNGTTASGAFTFVLPAITSITPNSGSTVGGTRVNITGFGFGQGVTVTFGGAAATDISSSDTSISAATPAHAAGAVDVVVTNPNGGTTSSAAAFTYVPPAITSISPSSGTTSGGTSVTVNGSGFAQGAIVTFGGVAATNVNVSGDTFIFANTPAHAAGTVDVVVTNSNATSATKVNGFTYIGPSITSISPSSGTTGGGTSLIIGGAGFAQGASVTIGGLPATNVSTSGESTIFASTPAHAAGSVNVVVTNPNGSSVTRTNGFTYILPSISSITPSSGNTLGGTSVAINGAGFVTGATVTFGGAAANVSGNSGETTVFATTPAHAAGSVDVVITNPNGTSTTRTNGFTYVLPAITSISPASGNTSGGTRISINGSGFAQGVKVTIGGASATNIFFGSETSISATTPAHAAGAVDVIVTNPDGSSVTRANGFTYILPSITSISPTSGNTGGGTFVQIFGSGFSPSATVTFGGVAATNVFPDENSISARTPAHAAGSVNVVVTNPNGTSATSVNAFTYVLPAITSVSPNTGNTGGATFVQIFGSGFAQGVTVTFGGAAATNVGGGETFISARTPAHVAGIVNVVVTNPNGTSATSVNAFTYVLPAITSISPNTGNTGGGTSVSINGAGFAPGATVTLGGVAATNVSSNETSISFGTPAHAAGSVNLVVTNPDGATATAVNGFTYVTPSITSVTPPSGPSNGGTFVTIAGAGFSSNTTVTFGGVAGTSVFVFNNESSISVMTPLHAEGAVTVVVTNPNGATATRANGFTYLPSIILSFVTPTTGSSLGGTPITINGSGFESGATVKTGGVSATNVVFVNSNILTAVTGPHPAGFVNVLVTNTNGISGSQTNGYGYVAAPQPQVNGITPTSGSSLGGTPVTISGGSFAAGATVKIGGSPATNVSFINSNTLTATSGPHASGLSDVQVTNVDSQTGTLSNAFTFIAAPPPTVSSILPVSGSTLGGTPVTIIGTGFGNLATLTIGGNPATNVTFLNSTTIVATTGAGTAGVSNVVLTNPDSQSASLPNAFTYITTPSNDNFDNRFPIVGAGSITASGSNVGATTETGEPSDLLGAGVGTPSVWWTWTATCSFSVASPASFINTSGSSFDTILGVFTGSSLASLLSFASDDDAGGNLTSMVPSPTPGPPILNVIAGTVFQIRVRGFAANSTGTITLHIDSPCGISGVIPSTGSYGGGTTVTIMGAGFTNEATVSFGGVNASSVNVVNPTTITATTPSHPQGLVNVTVTNPDQTTATLPNGFTFLGSNRPRGQITSQ